jgi:hypothetical protein
MSQQSMMDMLNKLTKWRRFFAAWQLGTRAENDGEFRAVADHREVTILNRAELNAFLGLLVEKKIITVREWEDAVEKEAEALNADYERRFRGITAGPDGLSYRFPAALNTMKDMGFPP